jgi:hypothetical protein
MDLVGGCGTRSVDWILAQGEVQWWTHAKEIMNLPGAENSEMPL